MNDYINEIEKQILLFSSEVRKTLDEGDALFTQKRQELDLESAFDPERYEKEDERQSSLDILSNYLKQLELEKNFYETTIQNFTTKLLSLISADNALELTYKEKVFPRVMKGFYLRININKEKSLATSKSIELINCIQENDDKTLTPNIQRHIENLNSEIDRHLENQYSLGMKQRANNLDSEARILSLLQLLKTT